ncbi:MAG: L-threonylcarbamoyladenylate synthase [Candidatus Parvarchaeum sp.]
MTKIIKISERNINFGKIKEAAKEIKKGRLVIFPTETVYGIGANAFDPKACREIFRVKKRAADNPLIVHISGFKQLDDVAYVNEETVNKLKKLWPGPITFVLKKKKVPDVVTAGLDTVAVRMPNNKIALALISESGTPIAAPSANISTFPSSTEAKHALADFNGKVSVIIDGGKSEFGIESTVIDISRKPYRLLRPGAFDVADISKIMGKIIIPKNINRPIKKGKPLSPGMKYRHYSPRKPLFLFNDINNMKKAYKFLLRKKVKFTVISPIEYSRYFKKTKTINLGSIKESKSISRNLFSAFRKLDEIDAEFGLISKIRLKSFDLAVRNRMEKAAGENQIKDMKSFFEAFDYYKDKY